MLTVAWMLAHEPMLRLGTFVGVFALVAGAEALAPRRARQYKRLQRWPHNFALVALNTVLARLAFPLAVIAFAAMAAERGWGLFNLFEVPFAIALLASLLALDLTIYLQHVMFHAVPLLWRLHRVHHSDPDFDVTTGARFHPLEILLSNCIKFGAIALLGPPVVAVLMFEILLNATAMFNHANLRLPTAFDRILRRVLVTPDMHRVHHSSVPAEANSNFGFNLPWWDHLFGTYRAQPVLGHARMDIGVSGINGLGRIALPALLAMPFSDGRTGHAIGHRFEAHHEPR